MDENKDFNPTESSDYDEVIQLTEYTGAGAMPTFGGGADFGAIAQYDQIDVGNLETKYKGLAKNFTDKVKTFVMTMNDEELSQEHKEYMEAVAEIQMSSLADLLYLCAINKQMINNVVNRINATMVEDYAIIQSYTSLVKQHMMLIKDLMTHFKSIPGIMKRLKTEVITDQLLPEGHDGENLPSSESFMKGEENEFNNRKDMLRKLAAEIKEEQSQPQ